MLVKGFTNNEHRQSSLYNAAFNNCNYIGTTRPENQQLEFCPLLPIITHYEPNASETPAQANTEMNCLAGREAVANAHIAIERPATGAHQAQQ